MVFTDRAQAGQLLAPRLGYLRGHDPVVVGIVGGGLVVAAEVADELDAPLDVAVIHKVGVPGHAGLNLAAIGEGGVTVSDHQVVRRLHVDAGRLSSAVRKERPTLAQRTAWYRRTRPAVDLHEATVVLVTDGIMTGLTVRAAIRVVRAHGARTVVLGVPVAPVAVLEDLARSVEQVICPRPVRWLHSVASRYVEYPEVRDTELIALLRAHRERVGDREPPARTSATG